ncbi:MAG: 5-oxoprolinase subunit PxpB [SAR202 cluster bacterium]|nr:5-oxoprolinase subunit PxpB [SAR202 cluster bacterium]|tara:strand:+ start:6640 stop:7404 length:765 start_codon:yes stop_codon:yes gene_type:complete
MTQLPTLNYAGDQGILVEFGDKIDVTLNDRVRNLMCLMEQSQEDWIVDLVPSYKSLLVIFNPTLSPRKHIENYIIELASNIDKSSESADRIIKIPTLYGSEFGMDLEFVASNSNLTTTEVISLHSQPNYRVFMIGFAPGFPYLGGLNQKLATPRLENPRLKIPAGSVGIADNQTGIYPNDSPGGWQLIGRTPLNLFDLSREKPSLLIAGDYIKFEPLENLDEYSAIQNEIKSNNYKLEISILDNQKTNEPESHE